MNTCAIVRAYLYVSDASVFALLFSDRADRGKEGGAPARAVARALARALICRGGPKSASTRISR